MHGSNGASLTISMTGDSSSGPDPKKTDVTSVVRAQLASLRAEAAAAAAGSTDNMTKYHLQDVAERIKRALDPK